MTLLDQIPEKALVALDTVIWIYAVEAHPFFGPTVRLFFEERLAPGKNRAGSSLLALGELLVQPLALGRKDLASGYRSFFKTSSYFSVWAITQEIVEKAAEFRGKHRIKMMDAIHVATAFVNHADLLLTNDEELLRIKEVNVVTLSSNLPFTNP